MSKSQSILVDIGPNYGRDNLDRQLITSGRRKASALQENWL